MNRETAAILGIGAIGTAYAVNGHPLSAVAGAALLAILWIAWE